jgi:predicted AlkP superfamily phosphohydrolase/phosphomutase
VRDEVTLGFARDCLRRGQPDCLVVYFRGIDSMQHKFRKYHGAVHDPLLAGFLYDVTPGEAEQLGGVIDRYAEYLDECLGAIVTMLEPETTVLVVSDHGHGYRSDSQVNLRPNALLVPLGWTDLSDGKIDFATSRVYGRQDPTRPDVLRIYVNVVGRGESGFVPRGDLNEVLEEARSTLTGLRTSGGKPLFEEVERGRGVGTSGSDGDLRCRFNWEALGGTVAIGDREMPVAEFAYQTPKSGNHRITGLILLSGGDAAKGRRIRGADVFDVVPTLFRLLDLPLSREWEGDPVEEALAPAFRELTEPRWVRSYETGDPGAWEDTVTEGADEAVLEELRSLGYIQ